MKTTPVSTEALKALAGRREADRRSAAAAADVAATAAEHGLLDVALGAFESPVGELLLAVTPRGLAYVAFEEEERDELLGRFSRQLSPRILEHPASTDEVRRQLDEYFAGERTRFELKLDRRMMRGIARDVLAATARVPFGRTTTYGALAERIGRNRASSGG
jgi:methylated-DNA-[protein]-cysteine S-methyltransferase